MKIMVATFAYNEGVKITNTLKKFPTHRNYDLFVFDDGSTDRSLDGVEEQFNVKIIRNEKNLGVGHSIRKFLKYGLEQGYDVAVIVAGNDKDNPLEIPLLLEPILQGSADFVQGSRYLPGGGWNNMPLYRQVATRFLHPFLMSFFTKLKITDSTNGFRAIRLSILQDKRIDLDQKWLNKYELEPYLLYKSITCGYKTMEIPVTKIYPNYGRSYTKMRPLIDWWSILRPLLYLYLGIKR